MFFKDGHSCNLMAPSNVISNRNEYFAFISFLADSSNGLSIDFICCRKCEECIAAAEYAFRYPSVKTSVKLLLFQYAFHFARRTSKPSTRDTNTPISVQTQSVSSPNPYHSDTSSETIISINSPPRVWGP